MHALSELARQTDDPPISWLMKTALEQPNLISLAAGFTDNASLPVRETKALLEEIFHSPKLSRATLQYGSTIGDHELRRLTATRLSEQDGQAVDAARLVITHGSQQLLYLVTECLCDPGDIVLVEDPTYFVYLSILQSRGVRARGVHLDANGIRLERLEAVLEDLKRKGELRRLKFLYLVTYFQNPTGITTAMEKKQAALALLRRYEKAAGHPIFLVEDAAYRDLRFAGTEVPSALAASAGAGERVVYAGTYSKPFATGIRVGYGVLPRELFDAVVRVKGNHDFGTSNLLQQVLLLALRSGRYAAHVVELQKRYRRKASCMIKAVRARFPSNVSWDEPEGGLYVWTRLPAGVSCGRKSRLFKAALQRQVLFVPGELCYAEDETRAVPKNEMRLSFGSASETDIQRGIQRLGEGLHEFCPTPARPTRPGTSGTRTQARSAKRP